MLDPADELAGEAGGGVERDHQDHQAQSRRCRRPAERALQIHRQKNVKRHDRAPAKRMSHHGQSRGGIGQHGDGNERLACGQEPQDKTAPQHQRGRHQRKNWRREPRIVHAAEIKRQHEGRTRRHDQHRTQEIELMRPVVTRQPTQHGQRDHDGDDAKREVPQEDHPPRQVVADPAAKRRTTAAGGGEGDGKIGVILGAILGRGDIAQNHLRDRGQTATTAALRDAAQDQHHHAGR